MSDFNNSNAFLGRGLHFPIEADPVTGRLKESSYEENIKESIYLIVMTRKGERVMRPDFGCDIVTYMFDNMDYTALTMMRHAVEEAVIRWEPRVTDIEVKIEEMEQTHNAVEIQIAYRVRATNNPFNLVFPFYLEEK